MYRDDDGCVRVVVQVMSWEAYVHLAYDEIRLAGAGSPQIARRLRASIEDLLEYAPVERHDVLRDELQLLELTVREQVPEHELSYYLSGDRQGIGVAAADGSAHSS